MKNQRPKARAITLTPAQIEELIAGRGNDIAELISGKGSFAGEAERKGMWKLFKGQVYAAMRESNLPQKHPAGFYEYESFSWAEYDQDKKYLHHNLMLSCGERPRTAK